MKKPVMGIRHKLESVAKFRRGELDLKGLYAEGYWYGYQRGFDLAAKVADKIVGDRVSDRVGGRL